MLKPTDNQSNERSYSANDTFSEQNNPDGNVYSTDDIGSIAGSIANIPQDDLKQFEKTGTTRRHEFSIT